MNETSFTVMRKTSQVTRYSGWRSLTRFGLLGLVFIFAALGRSRMGKARPSAAPTRRAWVSAYAQLPLSFEVNQGQTNPRVRYLARGPGYTLFLTSRQAVLTLARGREPGRKNSHPLATTDVVRMELLGASRKAKITGADRASGYSNYFMGNDPRDWRTRIPHYAQVRYQEIYPGVDLVYSGRQGQLENDFILSSGANPKAIRMGVMGVESMRVDPAGGLILKARGGEIYLRRPLAYQGRGRDRREVAVRYALHAGNRVAFALGAYNHRQKLVIDPVLAYSTYLGGTGGDIGYGIAVDSSGNAYVTGITNSSDFPATTGAQSTTYQGNGDVFVAKLNPAGSASSSSATPQLVYSAYLGGTGTDSGAAIAVNAAGDAFVTGSTASADFPTTSGVFQSTYGGSGDAFVTELNSTGTSLVYSSYLGGTGADAGMGIAVDSSGNAYVTGSTQSPDFPTVNPLQPTNAGSSDAFVAKVNFTGSHLIYSTYLGGSSTDVGTSIQVDSSGDAYVAGFTFSRDFPLQNPVQGANAGTVNAFASELNPAGSALIFSTYLGGSADDRAFGLALDGSGNIYLAGSSTSTDFPTSVGAFQSSNHGQSDAFVAKLKPSGPTLVYSTLLGGSGTDQANGIAVDSSGDAFVTGFTESNDFPLQSPTQAILGITAGSLCGSTTCPDAFVSEVNPTGAGLIYSSFLGGSGADFGQAIALDTAADAYLTGSTSSTNFPAIAGVQPAYQSSLTGVAGNAFVAEIKPANAPGMSIVPATLAFGNQTENVRSAAKTVTITNEGTAPLDITQITFTETDTSGNTDFAETDNCVGTVAASGGSCSLNITFTPRSLGNETGAFSIADNAAGSPQTIKVTGSGVTAATAVTLTPKSLAFGNQTVGATSSPQTVTITNTGSSTLDIASIAASGDFTQTNTCGSMSNVLNVGQSCAASVTFAPSASGALSGALSISDNAAGSPQSVALSGTGVAVFTLSSPSPAVTSLISNTGTATFKVSASAPSTFTGSITLASSFCATNTAVTCSFSPTSIFSGQTSTLTITNIPATVASNNDDSFKFFVTGTSGSQSATVNLTLLFADYSLSATPSLNTIVAGSPATYTVAVAPINGFNKAVTLGCNSSTLPPGSTCGFSQSSVTPSGGLANTTLTINTTKNSSTPPPAVPPAAIPPLMAALLVLGMLGIRWKRRSSPPPSRPMALQVLALGLIVLLGLLMVACRPSSTTTTTGSTPGNYIVSVTATLNSDTAVIRSTTVDLSVTPNP